MCTRPDRHSVPTSGRALRDAVIATLRAFGVLLVALVSAPIRLVSRRRPQLQRPAAVAHIDIQVHLEDRRCAAELKRVIRQTLRRTARTWAPLPLPIDRVVVGVGFPTNGKVDLYHQFPGRETPGPAASRPFAVVSLGLRDGERDLEPAEVAGALAAQIQVVIDEQCRQRSTGSLSAPASVPTPAPARPAAARASQSGSRPAPVTPSTSSSAGEGAYGANGASLVDPSLPRLQDLLATVQQGQPLDAAGPSTNHTNP